MPKILLHRLKHLRGRHDQRDHAWNRGMGKGSGYMPAALSPQQFQNMRADFQTQVQRGEITQEVADATMKRIREIYNNDYDTNISNQLSRRESVSSALANQRSSVSAHVSAYDLATNATLFRLANSQTYTGQDFNRYWHGVANNDARISADDIMEAVDSTTPDISGNNLNILLGKNRLSFSNFFDNVHVLINGEDTNFALSDRAAQVFDYLSGNDGEMADLFTRIEGGLPYIHEMIVKSDTSLSETLSRISKQIQEDIKKLESITPEDYTISDEDLTSMQYNGNDDPYRVEENAIANVYSSMQQFGELVSMQESIKEKINFLKIYQKIVDPNTILALDAAFSSGKQMNIMGAISRNSYMYIPRVSDIMSYDFTETVNDKQISQIISGSILDTMSSMFTENIFEISPQIYQSLMSTLLENHKFSQEMTNEYVIANREERNITAEEMMNTPLLGIEENTFRGSSYFSQMNVQTFSAMMSKQISDSLNNILGPHTTNLNTLSADQKNAIEQIIKGSYDTVNSLLSRGPINPSTPEAFAASVFIRGLDFQRLTQLLGRQAILNIAKTSASEFGTTAIWQSQLNILENLYEQERIANMSRSERHQYEIDQIWKDIRAGKISENDGTISIDNLNWQKYVQENADTVNYMTSLEKTRLRLEKIDFLNASYRKSIEERLKKDIENRINEVEQSFGRVVLSYDDNEIDLAERILGSTLNNYVDILRFANLSESEITSNLQNFVDALRELCPKLDMSNATNDLINNSNLSLKYEPNAQVSDMTKRYREAAWGDTVPVLIQRDSQVNPDDSVFGSPAFAYGNRLASSNKSTWLPPDNPDEHPLYNPAYSRFGARTLIEKIQNEPINIFSKPPMDSKWKNIEAQLQNIGYSEELISDIKNQMLDSLFTLPRDNLNFEIAETDASMVGVSVVINYRCNSPMIISSGYLQLKFHVNPADSSIEKHVSYMKIPENVFGSKNPFKGSAAPILMHSGDQMRRLGYLLGTNNVTYQASAENIDNRSADQSSGPTTWPVLGGSTPIYVHGALIAKLTRMGYSEDFLNYLGTQESINSSLLFLNAPPRINVMDNRLRTRTINTTTQGLWSELMAAGAIPSSFHVELNVATPNDPGRLYNLFIPGAKKPSSKTKEFRLRKLNLLITDIQRRTKNAF